MIGRWPPFCSKGEELEAVAKKLATMFSPTGMILYDIAIPAVVMAIGCVLLAVFGVISENVALLCFGVSAMIHVFLLWIAGFDRRKKDEKQHG